MVIAALTTLIGVVVGVVVSLWWAGVLLGAIAGAGLAAVIDRRGEPAALAGVATRPADPDEDARLHNLTEGLCNTVGVAKPQLLIVDTPTANIAAIGRDPRSSTLVVTSGLLATLERIDLEGVVAHQLRRIKEHDAAVATRAVGFAPLAALPVVGAKVTGALGTADDLFLADRAAVDVTRYPPGLVGALVKIRDAGADVPGVSAAAAHLWLVPLPDRASGSPDGRSVPLPSLDDRIAALREL